MPNPGGGIGNSSTPSGMKVPLGFRRGRHVWKQRKEALFQVKIALLEKQKGLCAICETEISIEKAELDHDHSKGLNSKLSSPRGVLCHQCNHGLGFFKDSVERLKKAILFLEKKHGET